MSVVGQIWELHEQNRRPKKTKTRMSLKKKTYVHFFRSDWTKRLMWRQEGEAAERTLRGAEPIMRWSGGTTPLLADVMWPLLNALRRQQLSPIGPEIDPGANVLNGRRGAPEARHRRNVEGETPRSIA